jgi:CRISPR-associated protein Csc2
VGVFADYADGHLLARYENFPRGRYATLVLSRRTESETVFRTEGSGEDMSKETVLAGLANPRPIRRVVISKRKQVAVERRTGRELLREHNLLYPPKDSKEPTVVCALNTNAPCERCIDCMLYGYAVGGGGAQKSRVMTEDAYSLSEVAQVTGRRTFNATFDNGTMRNPITGEASTSLGEDEYVLPQTHFLDLETLKDVTEGELEYVLANVLRSARYGAVSSRQGRVRNTVLAVIFTDCEVFSNLELTQAVFDDLAVEGELPFPLADGGVAAATQRAIDRLLPGVASRAPVVIRGEELEAALNGLRRRFREPEAVTAWLREVEAGYGHPPR